MIVVTAPAGRIGRALLPLLLASGEPIRVIARSAAKLGDDIRSRVEVIEGSHRDATIVDRALDGADSLFWLVPADPSSASVFDAYVGFTLGAAEIIRRRGLQRVVTVSSLGEGVQLYAGNISASLAADALLRATGAHIRVLANATFMDNVGRQREAIFDHGVLMGTLPGDLALPAVATRDIAAVAANLLADRGWEGQSTLDLPGPEEISLDSMAAILTDVLGRHVSYVRGERDDARRAMEARGMSPAIADAVDAMDRAKELGIDRGRSGITADTPTSFRQWVTEEFATSVTS